MKRNIYRVFTILASVLIILMAILIFFVDKIGNYPIILCGISVGILGTIALPISGKKHKRIGAMCFFIYTIYCIYFYNS